MRGEEHEAITGMLEDARRWDMQIVRLSRSEYRRRNNADYLAEIESRFAPCLVIPEGGASLDSALACKDIAASLLIGDMEPTKVVRAVGTGTTLAGVVAGLGPNWDVLGVSALKGADDLATRAETLLEQANVTQQASWSIDHRFHCGGFAKVSAPLQEFVLEFEATQGIPLDPVYTAKAMFAVHQMRLSKEIGEQEPIVFIHTGGLQGRRGQAWMQPIADSV